MKLNKKGYTLIELLVVIVVIGLILGFATFGIIKAYNNSKGKASDISEGSIIDAGETYANEKTNDENYWKNIIDKEEKYFCVTIEELMNKGLLDKKADIKSDKFNIHSYVLVKKNKVTSVNSNGEILTDINSDDYKVCSGSISDEKIISYPKLDKGDSYTDEIDAPFSDAITDSEDEITDRVCMYGDSSANIKETGTIEGNDCKLLGLKQNSIYYLRVCIKTSRGNYLCSNTESRTTKKIKDPIITINNNVNIEYKNDGINGETGYYFNSTIKGTSDKDVQECTLSNNIFTCQDGNTKEIKGFTWYKTLDNNINIT
ncbi:MAG: type II secretion system protein, partial [Bacilli bacterium]|nr:type II secretion system protein [Bacilli bacterium]